MRAALGMQELLTRLNEEFRERWATELEIRIGVNTGELVAGDLERSKRPARLQRAGLSLTANDTVGDSSIGRTSALLQRVRPRCVHDNKRGGEDDDDDQARGPGARTDRGAGRIVRRLQISVVSNHIPRLPRTCTRDRLAPKAGRSLLVTTTPGSCGPIADAEPPVPSRRASAVLQQVGPRCAYDSKRGGEDDDDDQARGPGARTDRGAGRIVRRPRVPVDRLRPARPHQELQ